VYYRRVRAAAAEIADIVGYQHRGPVLEFAWRAVVAAESDVNRGYAVADASVFSGLGGKSDASVLWEAHGKLGDRFWG
jgi:hypothetical protein